MTMNLPAGGQQRVCVKRAMYKDKVWNANCSEPWSAMRTGLAVQFAAGEEYLLPVYKWIGNGRWDLGR